MVQMSIHQCYCDLYRIFFTGYAEAAPISAIEGIDTSRVTQMRTACLDHAQSITQLLIDFEKTGSSNLPILLDFDAAVCSYHSLRLQLFAACTTGTGSSAHVQMELAISNTKDCLEIMNQLFGLLKSVTPMVSFTLHQSSFPSKCSFSSSSRTWKDSFVIIRSKARAQMRREKNHHIQATLLGMRPSARDFQFIVSCSRLTLSMTVLRRLDLRPNQVLPSQILASINMLPLQMRIIHKICNQYTSIQRSTEKIIVSSSTHHFPGSREPTSLVLILDTNQMTFRYRSWIHGNFWMDCRIILVYIYPLYKHKYCNFY